jgi:hypothetical protein
VDDQTREETSGQGYLTVPTKDREIAGRSKRTCEGRKRERKGR